MENVRKCNKNRTDSSSVNVAKICINNKRLKKRNVFAAALGYICGVNGLSRFVGEAKRKAGYI
jgi:hypothetical protein